MMRLQKYLARCGVASRRACEEYITSGRVKVNGEVVSELGSKIDEAKDTVAVDDEVVYLPEETVVVMLNKPSGFVTTMNDPQGRPTVAELIPQDRFPSLFPVGRLDLDTTGLLLFTNNGDLGNALLHPAHHVPKTYIAEVAGLPSQKALSNLENGIVLDDGPTAPAKVNAIELSEKSTIELTIFEGRKRQVKRMFKAIGHPVIQLHRKSFGRLDLGDLQVGEWRLLDDSEIRAIVA